MGTLVNSRKDYFKLGPQQTIRVNRSTREQAFALMVLSREYGSTLHRDSRGITFLDSLLPTSKPLHVRSCGFVNCLVWLAGSSQNYPIES